MRKITKLIVCYWSVEPGEPFGMPDIDKHYRAMGYIGTPYHYCVRRNGVVETGRRVDRPGLVDHPNAKTSINVVLILPFDESGTGEVVKYTAEQREAAESLMDTLRSTYPDAQYEVLGPVRDNNGGKNGGEHRKPKPPDS